MKYDTETLQEFRTILRQLETEMERNLSEETQCCGVTVSQCHLLIETGSRKSASLSDLADALELDKSTLSRTVDSLVQRGFVKRDEDSINRRKVSITLTKEGAAKTDSINTNCNSYYAEVFSNISEDKHEQIMESLSLLASAMKKSRKKSEGLCCGKK
jgi:DNA-binding MarR family transcriptional regulator